MNGWSNWETWNAALWIQNDEGLYEAALQYQNEKSPYREFVAELVECGITATPDGMSWDDQSLNVNELNEMIREL